MTGGSLPAQTWHEIMAYAHQGIELKPIPGLGPQSPSVARTAAAESRTDKKENAPEAPSRGASVLTKRGADALVRIERLMDDATKALAARGEATKASNDAAPRSQETFASASERQPAGEARRD
jgi:penicillin-binding protein 1A